MSVIHHLNFLLSPIPRNEMKNYLSCTIILKYSLILHLFHLGLEDHVCLIVWFADLSLTIETLFYKDIN